MEYMFRAVNAALLPLPGVRIGHGRIYCPHDDGCGVCGDYPYVAGSMTRRETRNPVVRTTGPDGTTSMSFGYCENDHVFRCRYMGLEPDAIEVSNNGKVILLHFAVGDPPPPPVPPAPLPPDNEEGSIPYGTHDPGWPPIIDSSASAHVCQKPTKSTGEPCKRRTRTPFCYQHTAQATTEMKAFAGTWTMNGNQVNVPHSGWEARLELKASGTCNWKETKGANTGATRNGNWVIETNIFQMNYYAPTVGLVTWEAQGATPTNMSGTYRTPEVAPYGAGWGGDWYASKLPA